MKCCLLSFLLLTCIDKEPRPQASSEKKEFLAHKRYPYKGQMLTFQEWTVVIGERKRGFFCLPKQKVIISAPSDHMWLIDLEHNEKKPLLRKTRTFHNLNQFDKF